MNAEMKCACGSLDGTEGFAARRTGSRYGGHSCSMAPRGGFAWGLDRNVQCYWADTELKCAAYFLDLQH